MIATLWTHFEENVILKPIAKRIRMVLSLAVVQRGESLGYIRRGRFGFGGGESGTAAEQPSNSSETRFGIPKALNHLGVNIVSLEASANSVPINNLERGARPTSPTCFDYITYS